jgi:mannose-6-phosphate isomerase-like protein (cupin superfamily)
VTGTEDGELARDFLSTVGARIREPARHHRLRAAIRTHGAGEHVLVWSSEAGSTAHLLEAATESRSSDLWLWRLLPGDTYRGQADPARSQELFYVLSGALTLTAGDERVVVPAGASGRLRSDRLYAYANDGDVPVTFVRTVVLAR